MVLEYKPINIEHINIGIHKYVFFIIKLKAIKNICIHDILLGFFPVHTHTQTTYILLQSHSLGDLLALASGICRRCLEFGKVLTKALICI